MPYIAEKIVDMLYNIIKKGDEEDESNEYKTKNNNDLLMGPADGSVMRLKINSVGRVRRMYKNLIEN